MHDPAPPFHAGQLAIQERFDTRRLADTLAGNEQYSPEIHDAARRLIEAARRTSAEALCMRRQRALRPPTALVLRLRAASGEGR